MLRLADNLFLWVRSVPFFLRMTLFTRKLASTAWVPIFLGIGVAAGLLTLVRFLFVGRRLTI